MDINDIRSLTTVLGFMLFLVLVVRAWSQRARDAYAQASQLVFEGEVDSGRSCAQEIRHG